MTFPGKDVILRACAGIATNGHPVVRAACELAELHRVRLGAEAVVLAEIDRSRAGLSYAIDRWVIGAYPQALSAAYLNSESVGSVLDRLARYSAEADAALRIGVAEPQRHLLWTRVAELACAYSDLAFEVGTGRRKLPTLTYLPTIQYRDTEPEQPR